MIRDAIGWGIILWLIGYVLGFIFFFFLPPSLIGWAIMPLGAAVTVWVLLKRVRAHTFGRYLILALAWIVIAVVLDYPFIVQTLHPADGYYKLDVYLYYALTFALPVCAAWYRLRFRHL